MKRLTGLITAGAIFAVISTAIHAQGNHPNFSGEWHTDASQKPVATLSITQDATQITVKDSSGSRVFKLDGSPTPYQLDGTLSPAGTKPENAPVKTMAKWQGAKLALTLDANNGDRPFTVVDVYDLRDGGKTLMRERTSSILDQGPGSATKETTRYVK
jgi:hypothetical protein